MVRLPTRVVQLAAVDRVVPLVRPVAVPVGANAVRAVPWLPVLAPETVGGLRVNKACGGAKWLVNDNSSERPVLEGQGAGKKNKGERLLTIRVVKRHDIKVVVVKERQDFLIT